MMTPASIIGNTLLFLVNFARNIAKTNANKPKQKAILTIAIIGNENISARTPPNEAPEQIPDTSGPTRGLRNIPCIAAPANPRPIPESTTPAMRGKRMILIMRFDVLSSCNVPR